MRFSLFVLAGSLLVGVNAIGAEIGIDESISGSISPVSTVENPQPSINKLNTAERVGRETTRIGNQINDQYTKTQPKVKKEVKKAEQKLRKFRKKF